MIVLILLAYALLAAQPIAAARKITVTFSSFPLPSSSDAHAITSGPDGALWFTEESGNQIGRITTSGAITEYRVGSSTTYLSLYDITAGPDGALWFTELAQRAIGRITTSGVITTYTYPVTNGEPDAITTGPDGALWFVDVYNPKIGRVTTSGTFTVFTLPNGALDLTTGPDGAIWFTTPAKLGRITISGSVLEFAIPLQYFDASYITTGPDNALWVTGYTNNRIVRAMPSE